MAIPAAAHVLVWVALGSSVAWVVSRERSIAERLDRAEAEEANQPATVAAAPAALAGGKETAKAAEEVRTLRVENGELKAAITKLRADHDRLVASFLASPEGKGAEEPTDKFVEKPGFEDAVRSVVDRYAQEMKFREAIKKATGPIVPKKPQYAELAKALKLTPNQSSRFEQDIRGIQQELLEILQVPRDDGVVPIEEIQQAEQYPEGNPKRAEAFMKLIRLTIPGTQETYFERAVELTKRVKKSTEAYLDDSQRSLLDTIDLDWFGIKMQ